jgi:hypothetical protein
MGNVAHLILPADHRLTCRFFDHICILPNPHILAIRTDHLIAASFPTLKDEPFTISSFLTNQGLDIQLLNFAAEAVCDVVHRENANLDIDDLAPSVRNNAAFRALAESGAEFGIFKHRSKGGKTCITNSESTLMIMVHNTDEATGLGTHAPAFASKRIRRGTHYVHTEEQGELDFGDQVIEIEEKGEDNTLTTIDVCIFAEKIDGKPICRIELLVDAEMNASKTAFTACRERYGMKFKADDFVAASVTYGAEDDDFDSIVRPKHSQ